jgi:hypothetical protein
METLSVRCNHCGAPLQVSDATRFVTCQFCQSSLEVKRTESSIFTEEVAKIAENTGKMAESLEVIALQNELERLDRENAPALAAARTKELSRGEGAAAGFVAVVFFTIFISFGVFFAVSSSEHGAPFIFPLVGWGFALIGVIALVSIIGKIFAAAGGTAQGAKPTPYQNQRNELLKKLASYSDK